MATVTLTLEEYEALRSLAVDLPISTSQLPPTPVSTRKPRKKVSKYNRAFGKNLKALIRKHPKTKAQQLMARAHRMTKKSLKA